MAGDTRISPRTSHISKNIAEALASQATSISFPKGIRTFWRFGRHFLHRASSVKPRALKLNACTHWTMSIVSALRGTKVLPRTSLARISIKIVPTRAHSLWEKHSGDRGERPSFIHDYKGVYGAQKEGRSQAGHRGERRDRGTNCKQPKRRRIMTKLSL